MVEPPDARRMASVMRRAIVLAAIAVAALAQQPADLLVKISTYQFGQSRESLARFTRLVEESLGSPAQLKLIEARLNEFLQSNATPAAKDYALRELSLIATDTSVQLLAGMLMRSETAEMARYALARVPGRAADDALLSALAKTTGGVRIGIVNSLGQRGSARSVPPLRALVASTEAGVAEAAASALASIGDQSALAALAEARAATKGPLHHRVSEAYLQCGARMAANGNRAAALRVFRELVAADQPERLRIAALGGLAELDPRAAVPLLTAAVDSTSVDMQGAAIRFLSGIPGAEITATLVQRFSKLPVAGQVRLLAALADRGDVATEPLFVTTAKNSTGDLRVSALAGLGKLGNSSSVPVLAEAAAASQGAEQAAAREALYTLRGRGIDAAIVSALGPATGRLKVELIMAAGERGITAASDLLIAAIQDKDADVHREALRALRNVAGPAQVPALLQLLVNAPTATDRRETTQTLASVLRRSESARVHAVVSAYQSAGNAPTRLALLEAMGQTSSDEALPTLRGALKDAAPEIARGAILALSDWASFAPLPDLLAVARSEANPTLQVLALRGYLKLMALPSPRPPAEGAKMLAEALQLAKQPPEKRTALSLLASFPCEESLQVAESAMKDPQVAKEAAAAVERINGLLKFQ